MADIANPGSLYAKLQHQFHSQLRVLASKKTQENEDVSKNTLDQDYHVVSHHPP